MSVMAGAIAQSRPRGAMRQKGKRMFEVLALLLGAIGGLLAFHVRERWWARPAFLAYAFFVGLGGSAASGEFEVSVGFLVFDVGQVIIAGGAAVALAAVLGSNRGGADAERRRDA